MKNRLKVLLISLIISLIFIFIVFFFLRNVHEKNVLNKEKEDLKVSNALETSNLYSINQIKKGTQIKTDVVIFDRFDTVITITLYTDDKFTGKKLADMAYERFTYYNDYFDNFRQTNEIFKNDNFIKEKGITLFDLNNSKDKHLNTIVKDVLNEYCKYCIISKDIISKFNPTVGKLTKFWNDFVEKNNEVAESSSISKDKLTVKLPSYDYLKELTIGKLNFQEIKDCIKNNTLPKLTYLDLGGIAKGYTTEKVALYLEKNGLKSGIISAGGNVRTIGKSPKGGNWKVGIRGTSEILEIGENTSIVTSGKYERFIMVDNKKYHHIVDMNTLFPGGDSDSVTVITKDSTLADLLSTVLFLCNDEQRSKIINDFKNVGIEVKCIVLNKDKIKEIK